MEITLLKGYQTEAWNYLSDFKRNAAYMEMGLGKTFIGSETIKQWFFEDWGIDIVIVLCQKSKVDDWIDHLKKYTDYYIANGREYDFSEFACPIPDVMVINYDLAITPKRIAWFTKLIKYCKKNGYKYGVICDESSVLQHRTTARSKLLLGTNRDLSNGLGTSADYLQLLSGTPCNGKYENLWVQARLLGFKCTYRQWLDLFCEYHLDERDRFYVIDGYKDTESMIALLNSLGAYFLKAEDALDLPPSVDTILRSNPPKEYAKLRKTGVATDEWGNNIVADSPLKQFMEERKMLAMNQNKYNTIRDRIESNENRMVIGTNFVKEYMDIMQIAYDLGRPVSYVNGTLGKNLVAYDKDSDSITVVQYQAGSMGLNLQKANYMLMASPPVSASDYMQFRGRIYREGQTKTCFYDECVGGIVEDKIFKAIREGRDYTFDLYKIDKDKE